MTITTELHEVQVFTWTKGLSAEDVCRELEILGDQGCVCWVEDYETVSAESADYFTRIQRGDKVVALPGSIYPDGTWGNVEFIVRKVGWDES